MFWGALYCTSVQVYMTCIIIMSACAESLYPPKLLVTIHIFKAKEARDSIWHIFFFFLYINICWNMDVVTHHPHVFFLMYMYWFCRPLQTFFLLIYMYGNNFCNSKYAMVTYRIPTIIMMSCRCASGQVGSRVYIPVLKTLLRLEFESSYKYIVHV